MPFSFLAFPCFAPSLQQRKGIIVLPLSYTHPGLAVWQRQAAKSCAQQQCHPPNKTGQQVVFPNWAQQHALCPQHGPCTSYCQLTSSLSQELPM